MVNFVEETPLSSMASFYQEENLFLIGGKKKSVIDKDDLDEKEKKFPAPPSYFKEFSQPNSKAAPDLAKLSKKDYFILYQMKNRVNVSLAIF